MSDNDFDYDVGQNSVLKKGWHTAEHCISYVEQMERGRSKRHFFSGKELAVISENNRKALRLNSSFESISLEELASFEEEGLENDGVADDDLKSHNYRLQESFVGLLVSESDFEL